MRLIWKNYDISSNRTNYIQPAWLRSEFRQINSEVGFTDIIDMRKMFISKKPSISHNIFFKTEHFYQYLSIKTMKLDSAPGATAKHISLKFDIENTC